DLPPAGWAAAGDRAGGRAHQAAVASSAASPPRSALQGADWRRSGCTGAPADHARHDRVELPTVGRRRADAVRAAGRVRRRLEAAEAVCDRDGDLPFDMLDGLAALLDRSLLKQEEGGAGEPRFTMLEAIREYALERLEESGAAEKMRRRHAGYYLAATIEVGQA